MRKRVKILLLVNNQILLSLIEEVSSDLGQPDCKLINPIILLDEGDVAEDWLEEYTEQTTLMISSDKIITIAEADENYTRKYMMHCEDKYNIDFTKDD